MRDCSAGARDRGQLAFDRLTVHIISSAIFPDPAVPLDAPLPPSPRSNALLLGSAACEPAPLWLPLVASPSPQAGFPSPAADYVEETLDLNQLMVRNPPATFFVRVRGESMVDARIFEGDVLSVDRSIDPRPGHIVVASHSGDLYVKRLSRLPGGRMALVSENRAAADRYPPLYLDLAEDCTLWGVVTGSVRRF